MSSNEKKNDSLFDTMLHANTEFSKPIILEGKYNDIFIECNIFHNFYKATPEMIIELLDNLPLSHLKKIQEIIYHPNLYGKNAKNSLRQGTYDKKHNPSFPK